VVANSSATSEGRWLLYRLLADPSRLRLLALAAEEELSIGELSEVLEEPQPNVSRHAAALKQGSLVAERRQGTKSFLSLAAGVRSDAVVLDAIGEGRRLCVEEGKLERVAQVVRARDATSRAYFERTTRESEDTVLCRELPAYAFVLSLVGAGRDLAVDAGTGDGAMLDVLCPWFRRVVAFDRSPVQLERAKRRIAHREYDNVELLLGTPDSREVARSVGDGANAVFATRLLHHAAVPRVTLGYLASLLRPGGALLVLDYGVHEDESFREDRGDQWLGFTPGELVSYAEQAGLIDVEVLSIPKGYVKGAPDAQVPWLLMRAMRPPRSLEKTETSKGVNR
jgi:ArsR family transcriptional regulator